MLEDSHARNRSHALRLVPQRGVVDPGHHLVVVLGALLSKHLAEAVGLGAVHREYIECLGHMAKVPASKGKRKEGRAKRRGKKNEWRVMMRISTYKEGKGGEGKGG